MARFLDGPAACVELMIGRLPMYLRVVWDAADRWDALDQPEDTPGETEFVHVYRRRPGTLTRPIYVCRPTGGARGGRIQTADYEHMPEVDGEQLRETEAWRAWAMAQPEIA